MTALPSPLLVEHPRSTEEIAAILRRRLQEAGFSEPGMDPVAETITWITARFGEIVTTSLNAAPDRHLSAFTELLGGRPSPPTAARTHVAFRPAPAASDRRVHVPMHTRVALQAEGAGAPAVFETEADLELVSAEPTRAIFVDAGHRHYADVSAMVSPPGFQTDVRGCLAPVDCALHVALASGFGVAGLRYVRIRVGLQPNASNDLAPPVEWVVQTPNGDVTLAVDSDTTSGLTRSGEVRLVAPPNWPKTSVDGLASLWLTVRAARGTAPAAGWQPPVLTALEFGIVAESGPQPLQAASNNGAPLDISKDFYPFGERPRFGSFVLMACPRFGEAGARVELHVRLTNPEGATAAPVPPVSRAGGPSVVWEIETKGGFRAVGGEDSTQSLTRNGVITFTVPEDVATPASPGRPGPWLRGRLVSGHYGSTAGAAGLPIPVPNAPVIQSLAVTAALERFPLSADHLVSMGALRTERIDPDLPAPVALFVAPDVAGPALYVGLNVGQASNAIMPGRTINWFAGMSPEAGALDSKWQMLCTSGWRDCPMADGMADRSAVSAEARVDMVRVPGDPGRWPGDLPAITPPDLAWFRIVWPGKPPPDAVPDLPIRLAINSVAARHTQILRNEIVGSSNGRGKLIFKALRTPVIGPVLLQVREADDAWIAWDEVDSLVQSGPVSRHFTFDRASGVLRFGDGRTGRIPPAGANNIRLTAYRTGGGSTGNQPANATAQLRSAIPAVQSAVNLEPATGGADNEDLALVGDRVSAWIRHRDRAVCSDDFADLAVRASPQVARAFCVAACDLETLAVADATPRHGIVTVMVVPFGDGPRPRASAGLLAEVRRFLEVRSPPQANLVVVGPIYCPVSVTAEVAPRPGWSSDDVAKACQRRILRFLHPVFGGDAGGGWRPGEVPHRSDFHGLLEHVDGVDFVQRLIVAFDEPGGLPAIVSAGTIAVLGHGPP